MNKVRKKIIWIVCLIAVLTMGVTSANISKADRSGQREIVDNISNEVNDTDNNEKNNETENKEKESIENEANQEDKDNLNEDNELNNDNEDSTDDSDNEDKDIKDIKENEDSQKDNETDDELTQDEELNEEDNYSSSKNDKDYSNSNKNAYEIFMGNGLHVIGQVYAEDNKPFSFDGKWFALEDTQYVYAIEVAKEEELTLYKAYVLIENKESYIYFNVDEAKKITVLGYNEASEDTVSNSRYNQEDDYKNITPNLKVVPIYKYVNKDTGEEGKRYGSETSVGEKVIVVKKLRKWSSTEM